MRKSVSQKSRQLLAVALLSITLAGCGVVKVVQPEQRPAARSTFVNLDFEQGSGEVEGWTLSTGVIFGARVGNPAAFSLELDQEVKRSGRASARLAFSGQDPNSAAAAVQCIDGKALKGATWLRLSGELKTENAAGFANPQQMGISAPRPGGASLVIIHETEGEKIGAAEGGYTGGITGTRDWSPAEAEGSYGGDAERVCVGIQLEGPGTVWADNLVLEKDPGPEGLRNGGFEEGLDAADSPLHWEVAPAAAHLDTKIRQSGGSSLRLSPDGGASQCFSAKPFRGKTVKLAAMVRVAKVGTPGFGISIFSTGEGEDSFRYSGSTGDPKPPHPPGMNVTPKIQGTSNWERQELSLEVPSDDAQEMCVDVTLGGNGSAWVDSLEILK